MNQLLIICGPTATGKTKLAAKLAERFQSQTDRPLAGKPIIISADSRQVYQGMDIVTNKDRPKKVTVYGYDLVKPDQDFSVAHFVSFALPLIAKLHQRRTLPIVVGGTGLYLKALVQPFATINIKPDQSLRLQLNQKTIAQLQALLKKLNPEKFISMNHSDQLNPRRLIRAIEVARANLQGSTLKVQFDALWIGLTAPKHILDQRIKSRVLQRFKAGALKEKQSLISQGYSSGLISMSALGYSQLPDVNKWLVAEQQYSRRQLTWFKKHRQIHWFDITKPGLYSHVAQLVQSWYTKTI